MTVKPNERLIGRGITGRRRSMWADAVECGVGGCTRPLGHYGMHADYYRPRDPGRREGGGMVGAVLLLLLVVVVIIGGLAIALDHEKADDRVRHEYRGVTWLGDDCRVLDGGVLVCLVRPEA
jgi:hypothetical protein